MTEATTETAEATTETAETTETTTPWFVEQPPPWEGLYARGDDDYQEGFRAGYLAGVVHVLRAPVNPVRAGYRALDVAARLLGGRFSALTPPQRRVAYLVYAMGLSRQEAARVLGIGPEGVRYHLRRGAARAGCADLLALRRAAATGALALEAVAVIGPCDAVPCGLAALPTGALLVARVVDGEIRMHRSLDHGRAWAALD